MEMRGRKIAVLGLGHDGIQMVQSLAKMGACVVGYGAIDEASAQGIREQVDEALVKIEWKSVSENAFLYFDTVIHAPGGEKYRKARDFASNHGIPVLSDFDFACQFMRAPVIAVTGSCGKSTTVHLINKMLEGQGYKVACIGGEFARWAELVVDSNPYDYYLLELSSKRLEVSRPFHPYIAILLNLYPTHFERHRTFVDYAQAKSKIFTNQTERDFLIHEGTAENLQHLIRENCAKAIRVRFSLNDRVSPPGLILKNRNLIWINSSGERTTFSLPERPVPPPLLMDTMAAVAAAQICNVEKTAIQMVIDQLECLPSRLQMIRRVNNVTFIDDSAATNLGATVWALNSFTKPIIWIAGGNATNADSIEIPSFLREKLKFVVLTGPGKRRLFESWSGFTKVVRACSIYDAVNLSYQEAAPNDIVLYSPGFPPDPYIEGSIISRGKQYQKVVETLSESV